MLLRRITDHVKAQNWFAVGLDFFIVVVGVFIGIQVANWNDARGEFQQETKALVELRKELRDSIDLTHAKTRAYQQAAAAGKRSLTYLDSQKDCGAKCWDVIVDFMHASQWQDLTVSYSSYQNMRAQGFPENTAIVDAVESYRAQNINNASTFVELPIYRSLIRQLITVKAQEHYWEACWSLIDGIEDYILDCPPGMPVDEARSLVSAVIDNSNIKPHLTEWVGAIVSVPETLGYQNIAAQNAIDVINEELEAR